MDTQTAPKDEAGDLMESPALRSFIDATPKRKRGVVGSKSRMAPHCAEILRLKVNGYSLSRIKEFLKQQGVEVSRNGINEFIKPHLVPK